MIKPSKKEIALDYLRKYASKDLGGIAELLADDVVLRDWKIRVVGKEMAIAETRKNFEAQESIVIDVITTYENEQSIAAELKITIDHTEELYVVDVITFNERHQINSIRAYLGRGN